MHTTDKIAEYLYNESKGVINLSRQQAAAIMDIVTTGVFKKNVEGIAKLYQFNRVTNVWEIMRTVHANDEAIKEQIIIALENTPPTDTYKWECWNSEGEYEGIIFTVNVSLF